MGLYNNCEKPRMLDFFRNIALRSDDERMHMRWMIDVPQESGLASIVGVNWFQSIIADICLY